jgi:tetratricopeptide (TPR) repeat protein
MKHRLLSCAVLLITAAIFCNAQPAGNYDDLIKQARALMQENKLPEAKAEADQAIKLDPGRYEAFAVIALIAVKQGDMVAGKDAVAKALKLAPAEKRASLEALQNKLAETGSESSPESAKAPEQSTKTAPVTAQLTGEARRKCDALLLIVEDADKAKAPDERVKLLQEFMAKSAEFLALAPMQTNIWLLRGAGALELGMPKLGWQVGRYLRTLGADDSNDPKIRKIMAALERRGWLVESKTELDRVEAATDKLCAELSVLTRQAAQAEKQIGWLQAFVNECRPGYVNGISLGTRGIALWTQYLKTVRSNIAKLERRISSGQADSDGADASLAFPSIFASGASGRIEESFPGFDFASMKAKAEAGDATNQLKVAREYWIDGRIARDVSQAAAWLHKAAESGYVAAEVSAGNFYSSGQLGMKDDVEALKWYRRAADHGDRGSTYKIVQILCSSPNASVRNGVEALKMALARCQAGDFKDRGDLSLLAAACAEQGDFESARKYQKMALDDPDNNDYVIAMFRRRLMLYEANKPFHSYGIDEDTL